MKVLACVALLSVFTVLSIAFKSELRWKDIGLLFLLCLADIAIVIGMLSIVNVD